jgi:uncharacterized protein YjbJ (UPF0337 family)
MTQQSSSSNKPANTAAASSREVAGQVKETVGQVTEQAQQAAGQVVGQARQQVSTRLASQKDRAAEGLTSVAHALRQTGQQLRAQDQQAATGYIETAASQVERISNYLKQNDLGGLIDDVERFARRQPALFLGGTFVLGLLGARFLKSSRPSTGYGQYPGSTALAQRQPMYQGTGSTGYTYPGASFGTSPRSGSTSTREGVPSTQRYPSGQGSQSNDYQPED